MYDVDDNHLHSKQATLNTNSAPVFKKKNKPSRIKIHYVIIYKIRKICISVHIIVQLREILSDGIYVHMESYYGNYESLEKIVLF